MCLRPVTLDLGDCWVEVDVHNGFVIGDGYEDKVGTVFVRFIYLETPFVSLPIPARVYCFSLIEPGAVARSDAHTPDMRTNAGSILTSGKHYFIEIWS